MFFNISGSSKAFAALVVGCVAILMIITIGALQII
jgi:hypothetical protein